MKISIPMGALTWSLEVWRTDSISHKVYLAYLIAAVISILDRGKPYFVDKGSSYSLFSMSAVAVKNRKDNWCSLSPLHDEGSFKEIRTKESILGICYSVFISYN